MSKDDPCQTYRDELGEYYKERDDIKSRLGQGWRELSNGEDLNKHSITPSEERSNMQKKTRRIRTTYQGNIGFSCRV